MRRTALGLLIVCTAAGCVQSSNLDQVRPGMSREQVSSIMGAPESSMHTAGQECSTYTVMKDFWMRVPWSMSNRYQVCYREGRVEHFGRIDEQQAFRQ